MGEGAESDEALGRCTDKEESCVVRAFLEGWGVRGGGPKISCGVIVRSERVCGILFTPNGFTSEDHTM